MIELVQAALLAAADRWSVQHQERAVAEGWGLFLVDGVKHEIQRVDDPLDGGPVRFTSDTEALGWVNQRAWQETPEVRWYQEALLLHAWSVYFGTC